MHAWSTVGIFALAEGSRSIIQGPALLSSRTEIRDVPLTLSLFHFNTFYINKSHKDTHQQCHQI